VDTTSIRTTTKEVPAEPTECFACYEGWVYMGFVGKDENGEHVELVERVACRRCLRTSSESL
jgi:hypothetical protein